MKKRGVKNNHYRANRGIFSKWETVSFKLEREMQRRVEKLISQDIFFSVSEFIRASCHFQLKNGYKNTIENKGIVERGVLKNAFSMSVKIPKNLLKLLDEATYNLRGYDRSKLLRYFIEEELEYWKC